MGYQFIHIEAYARTGSRQTRKGKNGRREEVRKWSAAEIVAEAEREPDACPHVPQPRPPGLLHGCKPSEAVRRAEEWGAQAKDAQGRKLRADGLCMLAGVVSLPGEQAEDWPRYREAVVHELREQYGARLLSVVEHLDEAHPHLHFYCVPLDGERFEVLHPGRQAAAEKARQGAKKGPQNTAYKAAMVKYQDAFQNAVAARFGLTRLGPKKRRLTRAAWQDEKAQAKALAYPVPKALIVTPEDVKKQVTRKRLLGDEYESAEELAARLTALVQDKAAPLAQAAKLGKTYQEHAHRLERASLSQRERIEEQEARIEQLEDAVGLFTEEELQFAMARREKAQEEKRLDDEKTARIAERKRRIEALPGLLKTAVGAALTFAQRGLELLKQNQKPSNQEWASVEELTIREAMGENGQEPRDVYQALAAHSPLRVSDERLQLLQAFIDRHGPALAEEFERRRGTPSLDRH